MQKILFLSFFIFLNCSGKDPYSSGVLVNKNRFKPLSKLSSICKGSKCCSKSKECTRTCDNIFYSSDQTVLDQCYALSKIQVHNLESLTLILRSPIVVDLERLNLPQSLRFLLELDFLVFIRHIKKYNIQEARELLIWFAKDQYATEELKRLPIEIQNEILYESLASVGDRDLYSPVEEGLAGKISFNKSFFEYMISEQNYDLLQMTHQMIKDDLCSSQYNTGKGQTDRCALRVYCRERVNKEDVYVHSEDLRNLIARNLEDENFFNYIEREVLYAGVNIRGISKKYRVIDDRVCSNICNNNSRGCE